MGNCIGKRDKIKKIENDLAMLSSESRIQNDHLLREVIQLKQMLRKPDRDSRRYSYNPVTAYKTKIKYV